MITITILVLRNVAMPFLGKMAEGSQGENATSIWLSQRGRLRDGISLCASYLSRVGDLPFQRARNAAAAAFIASV